MTIAMFSLLLLGLLLIFLEAFVPGGVLGTIGAICIGASAWFCYQQYGATVTVLYTGAAMVVGAAIGITTFLTIAKRIAIEPHKAQENPDDLRRLIGQKATVIVDCDPTGVIEVNERRIQARAEFSEQEISRGATVDILKVDSTFLVIQQSSGEEDE